MRRIQKDKRLLIIGIDGLSYDLLSLVLKHEKTKFRNFNYIFENGASGRLKSTIPPWTIPAWITIHTGMKPDKIGIPGFLIRKTKNSFQPFNKVISLSILPNIWDIASVYEFKSIIFNIPSISEAYPINGIMIAGWLCTNINKLVYPRKIQEEIARIVNGYIIDPVAIDPKTNYIISEHDIDKYKKQCIEAFEKHHKVFIHLIEKYEWDLAFVVYTILDRLFHRLFEFDSIYKVIALLDNALGELLEYIDENTYVMIVSDHGFGEMKNVLYINNYFYHNRYLYLKENLNKASSLKKRVLHLIYTLLKKTKIRRVIKKVMINKSLYKKIKKNL